MTDWTQTHPIEDLDIAIVGMSGRFPGAANVDEFWQNLRNGVESISVFAEEELHAAGVDPSLYRNPNYVKARGILQDVDQFDAGFFGFYPREAELLDPQQRVFLECAWEALEDAGYDPEGYAGQIGVFGGAGLNTYMLSYLLGHPHAADTTQLYQLSISNEKDFLTTRISYKLNLRGPSFDVQTACSTSLVAVHLACQHLLSYQCDMALAGGVSIMLPQQSGYLFQEGMILSPDGHCRAFDANAAGTLSGNGAGIVVLKQLADAVADGDHVYAVIKGSAVNNDGARRIGYTAPGVEGQAEVIATAQALAGVAPDSIDYIEAHGTGTTLGDPIEIAALTQVFREQTGERNSCAIGSVKTNVGHLDAAAGVAGLIKTALALKHAEIPPSLHFETPNPRIDFASGPFYVNAALSPWESSETPRRAGVSSFGIGGTNAHVVLQEAPPVTKSAPSDRPWQLLLLSARSTAALDNATDRLAGHLGAHVELNLADTAFTLSTGRRHFEQRRIVVVQTNEDVAAALIERDPRRILTAQAKESAPGVIFMFSGQGSQYPNMTRQLYKVEPLFRDTVDRCAAQLQPILGVDLRDLLFSEESGEQLRQTQFAQPLLFVVEYALAQLLISWGIQPRAMIGHSIGEYVAACLAGVFSLEDALRLVAVRGRLMQSVAPGAMLSVPLPEDEVLPLLEGGLSLAVINATSSCVVGGSFDAVAALEAKLTAQGTDCRRLHTSHAFHSEMMAAILANFTHEVAQVPLNPPALPYISNVSGAWISAAEATDPAYYARHLRQTVRFADGIDELLRDEEAVFVEVGPGQTLCSLVKANPAATGRTVLSTTRHPNQADDDFAFLLKTVGRLWLAGVDVDWNAFYAHEERQRVRLPTYPFERQRYWLSGPDTPQPLTQTASQTAPASPREIADWFYAPSWQRADLHRVTLAAGTDADAQRWLIFADAYGVGVQIADQLSHDGAEVTLVNAGRYFFQIDPRTYTIDPANRADYVALFEQLDAHGQMPDQIVHCWSVTPDNCAEFGGEAFQRMQSHGFYSLLYLAQAWAQHAAAVQLSVLSSNVQEVVGTELLCPPKATILGAVQVIGQEHPRIACRHFDLSIRSLPTPEVTDPLPAHLVDEMIRDFNGGGDPFVAYRGRHRWVQSFDPIPLDSAPATPSLRQNGVYLITGGLGRIGLTIARFLAQQVDARLVLVGRSALPPRDLWRNHRDDDDPIGHKVRAVLELIDLGAEVMTVQADVANEQQMRDVIGRTYRQFGQLDGVIHAAGAVGIQAFCSVLDTGPAQAEEQFQAKIHGVNVLINLLKDHQVDFVLLQSSLAAVLGGQGFAAYAAANHYLDAVARQRHQRGDTRWISINWGGWRFEDEELWQSAMNAAHADDLMSPEQGVDAFKRLLSTAGLPQIVVSPLDLAAAQQAARPQPGADSDPQPATQDETQTSHYARPQLETEYVSPDGEVESRIAEVWQDLLGIAPVGRYDSFFDLGGNSLLGAQVVAQLRDAFHVELPLRAVFEDPTVAGVAQVIEGERENQQSNEDKISSILERLQALSDEEAQALLAGRSIARVDAGHD